ncbi:hypothetical protein F5Y08DRAFT_346785 [Xylaria arbuscula]|nr:hypothetical protein F5Y08DRAFT_346785 [Xylaria arbuscula]
MRYIVFLFMASAAFAWTVPGWERVFDTTHGVCGDTTWNNETPTGSADLKSCYVLLAKLNSTRRENGFELTGWKKGEDDYRYLAQGNDCVFEVRLIDHLRDDQTTPITFADMTDIVNDAIEKFSVPNEPCFGASRVMDCNDGEYSGKVGWRINGAKEIVGSTDCKKFTDSV